MSIQIRNYKDEREIQGDGGVDGISNISDLKQRQPAILSKLKNSDIGSGTALVVKDYNNKEVIIPGATIDSQANEGVTQIDTDTPAINDLLETNVPNQANWDAEGVKSSVIITPSKRYKVSFDARHKLCKLADTAHMGPTVLSYLSQGSVDNESPMIPWFDFYNKDYEATVSAINVKNIHNMPRNAENVSLYVYAFIFTPYTDEVPRPAIKTDEQYISIPQTQTRWIVNFPYMESMSWNMGREALTLETDGTIRPVGFVIPKDSMCIVILSSEQVNFPYEIVENQVRFEGNLLTEEPYYPTEEAVSFTGDGYLYNGTYYSQGYINRPVYRPKMKDIQDPPLRYLIESYDEGDWHVRKFSNGDAECEAQVNVKVTLESCGVPGINKSHFVLGLPTDLFKEIPVVTFGNIQAYHNWATCGARSNTEYEIAYFQTNLNGNNVNRRFQIRAVGSWK